MLIWEKGDITFYVDPVSANLVHSITKYLESSCGTSTVRKGRQACTIRILSYCDDVILWAQSEVTCGILGRVRKFCKNAVVGDRVEDGQSCRRNRVSINIGRLAGADDI